MAIQAEAAEPSTPAACTHAQMHLNPGCRSRRHQNGLPYVPATVWTLTLPYSLGCWFHTVSKGILEVGYLLFHCTHQTE